MFFHCLITILVNSGRLQWLKSVQSPLSLPVSPCFCTLIGHGLRPWTTYRSLADARGEVADDQAPRRRDGMGGDGSMGPQMTRDFSNGNPGFIKFHKPKQLFNWEGTMTKDQIMTLGEYPP